MIIGRIRRIRGTCHDGQLGCPCVCIQSISNRHRQVERVVQAVLAQKRQQIDRPVCVNSVRLQRVGKSKTNPIDTAWRGNALSQWLTSRLPDDGGRENSKMKFITMEGYANLM